MADKLRIERLGRLLEVMENWPADARPDRLESPAGEERMSIILSMGLGCGWLEQVASSKPCRECGQAVHDHSFYRITAAGQAALDAAKALRAEANRNPARYVSADEVGRAFEFVRDLEDSGDNDEFERKALEDAAAYLRSDAKGWRLAGDCIPHDGVRAYRQESARVRDEAADKLDKINHERNSISLSGITSREQAARMARADLESKSDKREYSKPELRSIDPFEIWFRAYSGKQDASRMRFSWREMRQAFNAGWQWPMADRSAEIRGDAQPKDETFVIITGDPRFDPKAPLIINGFWFEPARERADWDEMQERFAEDISDSLDVDWASKDGALAIIEALKNDEYEILRPRDA